jgi:predicted SAM-dependent methyltransferase
MPKFTVCYLTYRPGGYDVLADGLSHQTYTNYELICIDDMKGRRQMVRDYLTSAGVKAVTVSPSKPPSFPDLAYQVSNAYNTGIMLSHGDYLVFLHDYIWLPPDALEKFARCEAYLQKGICVTGVALTIDEITRDASGRHLDRPISIWDHKWAGDPLQHGYKIHSVWRPFVFELFYVAMPYDMLVKLNGLQECYDYATGTQVEPLLKRVPELGGGFFVDETNICYMLNHRDWGSGEGAGLWWVDKKVKPTQLIIRENTFDLKTHVRGTIDNNGGGTMVQQPAAAPQQVTVSVPFKQGGKILEVGGGDQPLFRPNLDMRKLPTVDYVCDLEEKWPVPDASYDGIFSKFVIEHMSWRKVPHFASECFRVLKPGGSAMMVGPNTLEQCKEIAKLNKIGIEESSLLYGGQEERGWNEHKAAFSPEYAIEVFQRAGFERVETEPWPGQIWTGARTDMIIRAYKAANSAYMKGDRHQWIRDQVKASESIIDLGCGPTSVWQGRGYNVKTVDERADFHPDIISKADSVPLPDKTFDVVVLGDILEHYDSPPKLLNEAVRLAKKRIVITVPWEEKWSKNLNPFTHHDHKINYTQSLLSDELARLGYDFTTQEVNVDIEYLDRPAEHWSWVGAVVNLEKKREGEQMNARQEQQSPLTQAPWYKDLEDKMKGNQPPVASRKLGLNVGSFTVMTKSTERTQWVNCDILDLAAYATQNAYEFKQFDARQGIPWPDSSVDLIIASHFLEHITRAEGDQFLKECSRVLKPGGILRITVPDTKLIAAAYGNLKAKFSANEGVKNAEDEAEAFWNFLTVGHLTAYDEDSLGAKMNNAGFTTYKCDPGESNSPEIKAETKDMFAEHSLYVEGVKPMTTAVTSKQPVSDKPLYKQYLDGEIKDGKQG